MEDWNLKMFRNKKDRIGTKQTLMELQIDCQLFVAQDLQKGFRLFRSGSPRNGYAILMSSCSNEIAASLGKPDSWSCVSQVCCTDVILIS